MIGIMQKREELTFRLGTLADNERFIREDAQAMTSVQGLMTLEVIPQSYYEDPDHPPRLERVFELSEAPPGSLRGRRVLRDGDPG